MSIAAVIPVDRRASCPLMTGPFVARQPTPAPASAAASDPVTQQWPTIDKVVGNTPLVRLQRMHLAIHPGGNNTILVKLEGSNPGGSAKDRPALAMLDAAEASGRLRPGGHVIECTTGNTGIALAMACAARGYKLTIIMPASMTEERKTSIAAYGAKLLLVPSLEQGRDLAATMARNGEGVLLDQNNNAANPLAHSRGTGPEIWSQTGGKVTHFIAGMGTSGTIMGVSAALKARNPKVVAIGLEPPKDEPTSVPGIRNWPEQYRPKVRDDALLDGVMQVSRREAEETARALARIEGLLLGVSAGGAVSAALRLSATVTNAVIVVLACDRADRYMGTGIFSAAAAAADPAPCPVSELASAVARFAAYPAPHYIWFSGAAEEAVGGQAAEQLQAQAQAKVDSQQGTLLVVKGHCPSRLDVAAAAALKRLVLHPAEPQAAAAAGAQGAPVLVQWHGADGSKSAQQVAGAPVSHDVTVVLRSSMLQEGMEVVV